MHKEQLYDFSYKDKRNGSRKAQNRVIFITNRYDIVTLFGVKRPPSLQSAKSLQISS